MLVQQWLNENCYGLTGSWFGSGCFCMWLEMSVNDPTFHEIFLVPYKVKKRQEYLCLNRSRARFRQQVLIESGIDSLLYKKKQLPFHIFVKKKTGKFSILWNAVWFCHVVGYLHKRGLERIIWRVQATYPKVKCDVVTCIV